jgi:2,4-dienoyl-CoA reductase-like NADH-dependent reductase (Old Yellow Enzyme family)
MTQDKTLGEAKNDAMSALFSRGRIGGLDLDNRIVVSPMCQYSAVDGIAQSWHLIHIGNLMLSGAGLVIMEATAVEAVGRGTHGCLGLYNDAQEMALSALVSEVRGLSNAKLGLQLTHCGRKASTRTIPERWRGEPLPPEEGVWTPVAPSALRLTRAGQCRMNSMTRASMRSSSCLPLQRSEPAGPGLT